MNDENELNALIVRNMADIEAAYNRATNEIERQLKRAVSTIFENIAEEASWKSSDDAEFSDNWLAPIAWRMVDEEEASDAYDLYYSFWYSHEDVTWLGTFVGAEDAKVGLSLLSNSLNKNQWKALIKELSPELSSSLAAAGFSVDSNRKLIVSYIRIDKEKLADGFKIGDLNEALEPITEALNRAVAAQNLLEPLVARIRSVAR